MAYVSLQKSQLLDSLENQVLYADLCTVIVGEEGLGKSFFIKALNSRMEGQVSLSQIDALTEMSVAQLEKSISLQLGLSWSESDNLVERITARFDQRVLLTIDDAHLLPLTCLEYLMMLVEEQLKARSTCVFIVLAGDASLAEKLNQTSVLTSNPNICVVFELQPIEPQETKHLIADFQAIDVGTTEALYDEQKLGYFFQLSKGRPGELKYQLNRWLAESSVKVEAPEQVSSVKKYIVSGLYASLALGLILVLVYQEDINQLFEGTAEQNDLVSQHQVAPKTTLNEPPDDSKKEQFTAEQSDPKAQLIAQNSLEKSEQQLNKQTKNDAEFSDESTLREISQTDSQPQNSTRKQLSSKTKLENSKTSQSEKAVAQNSQALSQELAAEIPVFEFTDNEKALRSFSDQQYTLQWVGVSSLKAAEDFRQNHPLKDQMLIFRRRQEGKLLYLVVSGQFNSRDDADHSRIIYKKRGYQGSPWIKSIAAVKADISSLQ